MENYDFWWQRNDLKFTNEGRLTLAEHDLMSLGAAVLGPAFFYSAERLKYKLQSLHKALDTTGLDYRIFYALKANRFTPLVTYMRTTGLSGVDVCSPNELEFALSCGFEEKDISFTATSISENDMGLLARYPHVHINCDSLSTIRRLGKLCPGRKIGLRVNPGKGVSYGDSEILKYSGAKTTKFGIYKEHFEEAVSLAGNFNLEINTIHFHVGIGYTSPQLDLWDEIVGDCTWFVDQIPGIKSVNLGGGLGLPHVITDSSLDLEVWSSIIRKHFGPRKVEVCVEPGDFIVKDCGVLVLQVNTVERKQEVDFIGVNGGFNLAVEPFFYGLPCEPVPCVVAPSILQNYGPSELKKVTIAGNINEAHDKWAEQVSLPPLKEGDFIAFINAGGYASSMSSNHCMRGGFYERLLYSSVPESDK
jgi:diaminopimelate decarboxylase